MLCKRIIIMMMRLKHLLPIAILILSDCAIITKEDPKSSWYQHQQKVRNLHQYQTRGVVTYFSNQQKKYGYFFWKQIGQDNYKLMIVNPLGHTELELKSRLGWIQITSNKNQYFCSKTEVEKIINKSTGMLIPFNNLKLWILGLPGDAANYKLNKQNYLRELNYNHNGKIWKVVYYTYNTKTVPAMPSYIELSGNGQRICLKMNN